MVRRASLAHGGEKDSRRSKQGKQASNLYPPQAITLQTPPKASPTGHQTVLPLKHKPRDGAKTKASGGKPQATITSITTTATTSTVTSNHAITHTTTPTISPNPPHLLTGGSLSPNSSSVGSRQINKIKQTGVVKRQMNVHNIKVIITSIFTTQTALSGAMQNIIMRRLSEAKPYHE